MLLFPDIEKCILLVSQVSRCSNELSLGLKFDECYYIHKGVFRGLWSRGILGVSYRKLKAMGIKVTSWGLDKLCEGCWHDLV